ncbi:MAG: mismatch repair protein, partial [Candidatus Sulfotelmatobacter sp.]
MSASEEYARRMDARRRRVARYEQIHIRLGNARLALAFLFVLMAWDSFHSHYFSAWWLGAPVAAFVGVAAYHSRVLRARELAERAVRFYERGVARIEDRWAGTGETGERFNDPHHVYAADLDLFGEGSLFELLSTARTRMGEETLAKWLLAPARIPEVRERQAAVTELREQLDLREDLAVLGADVRVGVNPDALADWAESANQMASLWIGNLAPWLAAAAIALAAVWAVWSVATPFVVVLVVEAILTWRLRHALDDVLHGAEHAFRDLDLLSGVLARVERHGFESGRLQALHQQLCSGSVLASQAIARLRTLVDRINSRHNVMVRILDAPLMYSVQVAFAAERWRAVHGKSVRTWIALIGEIEALLALGSYSFEHPADPFPDFVEGAAHFDATNLGHPLLPEKTCICNDVRICEPARVLLVSGSNMSGKSTLLRSVGMNVVLGMAGAPVRAQRLQFSALQVGASIRVNDSLREGSSRFYAEITRLRQILELAGGNPPLIFLLDELLQGTNSNDRRVGAEGMVRALVSRGAIGMVSTHDLALTDIGGGAALR